ncbi:hypothetical protein HYC85_022582 [Camellia sinensis]|uniref:Xylanase inhibitor C-terminal domain-containing protein n=1 Tax=Camellia sinensis TaxID=4442 RepID=A0A7J7GC22_CAMSI|nr:hypothetical protein HYC85_022582 [Camellia sinensis]
MVFALRNNGNTSGCIVDFRFGNSRVVKPAYEVLLNELQKHFSSSKNLKSLELCYQRHKPEGFNNLPTITFHYKGTQANLVIKPKGSFEVGDKMASNKKHEYFCLAMLSDDKMTSIERHE